MPLHGASLAFGTVRRCSLALNGYASESSCGRFAEPDVVTKRVPDLNLAAPKAILRCWV